MASHEPYHDAPEVVYGEGLESAQPEKQARYTSTSPSGQGMKVDYGDAGWTKPESLICGMRKRTFWIVLVVAIVVVVGAVGGGVGAALAGKSSKESVIYSGSQTSPSPPISQSTTGSSSSSSLTTTTTTSSSPSVVTVAVATDMAGCPLVNNTIFTAPSGSKFKTTCYYDILGTNIDIHMVSVSSLDSCIGLCDSYNTENGAGKCKSVVWDLLGDDFKDCWLKNANGTGTTAKLTLDVKNGTAAAVLQ